MGDPEGFSIRAALVILLILVPGAVATWYGPGSSEPSTPQDRIGGRMFQDPDQAPGAQRVYFNGYEAVVETSVSPNVALLGTSVLLPVVHHRAMLGAWKDCDLDGYIGTAASGLYEYRASLLPEESPCLDDPLRNDGAWVTEMIGIGMVDPCEFEPPAVRARCPGPSALEPTVSAFSKNDRVLYSNDTYVWADVGVPGEVPPGTCVLTPLPRGTTSSTGGALRYIDCQDGYAIAKAVNDVDKDGALGLRFEDPQDPRSSSSLLHQELPVSLLGDGTRPGMLEPRTGSPAWTAWDCSAPRAPIRDPTAAPGQRGSLSEVAVQDRTPGGRLTGPVFPLVLTGYTFRDEDGDPSTGGWLRVPLDGQPGTYAYRPTPGFALHAADASWVDAADGAVDGIHGDCDARTPGRVASTAALLQVERGDDVVPPARKDRTSFTFTFYDGHRGFSAVDAVTRETTPSDGGLLLLRHGRGGDGPLWSVAEAATQDPQVLQRGDLQPSGAFTVAYYARVGSDVVSANGLLLPAGSSAKYGDDNCGGIRAGVLNGWVCDPALWWRDASGADVRPRYGTGAPIGRVPGDAFDLLDVDCYDGSLVAQEGIRTTLGPVCIL